MISIKQLEIDFQRKLRQYKSIYQDYMVELKNEMGSYWNTEENVTVANKISHAEIPFLTNPDISKEECLHACSSDRKCKYVLFSDSGNGECAANQCLKWTQDAKGLIPETNESKTYNIFVGNSNGQSKIITLPAMGINVSPIPTNPQNPIEDKGIKFKVSVSGDKLTVTRTDKKKGWGQLLQLKGEKKGTPGVLMQNKACLPGKGPKETRYVYSGWEKPTWSDQENTSFMGNPSDADPLMWKELGNSNNLMACKEMSIDSARGPFSSVVFVSENKKCYGGVPEANIQNVKINGIYSSVPPTGSTALGGKNAVKYVEQLKQLNAELKEDLYKMKQALSKLQVKDAKTAKMISETRENINTDVDKLTNDRKKLSKLSDELLNLDVKLGILGKTETREKMIYMGSAFLSLLFIAFVIRKYS